MTSHTKVFCAKLDLLPPPPLSLSLSPSLVPDAEVMYLVSELISELPGLQEGQYRVLINHTSLLSSVLSYSSIPCHRHKELNNLLQRITVCPPTVAVAQSISSAFYENIANTKMSEWALRLYCRIYCRRL